jgi:hypothetical protein
MGWETRGRCRYYTRSRKVAGRVTREYYGTADSPEAQLAAALDEQRKRDRQATREAAEAVRTRWDCVAVPLEGLHILVDELIKAALLGAGYRQHERGPWRKRRNVRPDEDD